MLSKILIDVDEAGLPVISVGLSMVDSSVNDVRDKLVKIFLEGGNFSFVEWPNPNTAHLHSCNVLDILDRILEEYKGYFLEGAGFKEFEQSVYRLSSLLEGATGLRSSAFEAKVSAQSLV